MGGLGVQRYGSVPVPPGMTLYSLYRTKFGLQGRTGRARETLLPLGFEPRTVQPWLVAISTELSQRGQQPTHVIAAQLS